MARLIPCEQSVNCRELSNNYPMCIKLYTWFLLNLSEETKQLTLSVVQKKLDIAMNKERENSGRIPNLFTTSFCLKFYISNDEHITTLHEE